MFKLSQQLIKQTNKSQLYKQNLSKQQLNAVNKKSYITVQKNIISNQTNSIFNKKNNLIKQTFELQKNTFKFSSVAGVNTSSQPTEAEAKVSLNDALQIINLEDQTKFRNVAIVAHVDHGKTTLVDTLLQHCGCVLNHERSMDGNELEKEKGITILSKCTSITYEGNKINIVDTPGHCDFGGEVERIMDMVDSVILLVCATEGPMPQTRYVLQKAVKAGIKPIVVINKVDRPTARPEEVVNEVFELFCDLEIEDDLLDYPVFFCSGRDGWAVQSVEDLKKDDQHKDINVILKAILDHVPAPTKDQSGHAKMLISQTESNQYFGKMVIGRIERGVLNLHDKLTSIDANGKIVEHGKVQKIIKKYGMEPIEMKRAVAGDIVSIAGFSNSTVTHTLNIQGQSEVIPSIPIDPPIMSISINVNTSPIAGKEGKKMSKNAIKQRLIQEGDNDVALQLEGVEDNKNDSTDIIVKGRGDLHLGILVEKMRREGFELNITPPIILFKEDEQGNVTEPVEKITIEVDPVYINNIIEKLGKRGAIYENCVEINADLHRVTFVAPTRGLIGFRSVLLNDTKGTANVETQLIGYEPHKGPLNRNNKGALISTALGQAQAYSIKNIEQFGQLFIRHLQPVYPGMIIGESLKEGDMELNPCKSKELNNIRLKGSEEKIVILQPRVFTVEEAVSYIREDEMVEVTPKEIRMRKRELNPALRKRENRAAAQQKKKK